MRADREKDTILMFGTCQKNISRIPGPCGTHTDGHNQSGNIHTHIVINSVRKYSADREPYMTQPHDHEAGYKHRSTDKFLEHFKKEVMDMCLQEGLHQIDPVSYTHLLRAQR